MNKRIAYIMNNYPAVSHGFIRREIHGLERAGVEIRRFALRGWDGERFDESDDEERRKTRYILREGLAGLAGPTWRRIRKAPRRFFRAFSMALRLGWKSTRPMPYHLVYLLEACQLAEWLAEVDADHVHSHFATNATEVALLAHILGGPPYSFTVHGPEEFDNLAYAGFRQKIGEAAFVVAITHFTRSQLCRTVPFQSWEKIKVVRCGIDAEFFETPPTPVPEVPQFVSVGRLVEQKGQHILLQAMARLQQRGREARLVLVGGGPMESDLKATAENLGIADRVELTGPVITDRLLDEIRRAKACVLPSFAEGLPMVIMEAMALGRPVITTYIAGIPELVSDGESGFLVPAGDADGLADAMERVLDAPPEVIEAITQEAFRRASEQHSAPAQAVQLARLFGAQLEERRAVPHAAQSGVSS